MTLPDFGRKKLHTSKDQRRPIRVFIDFIKEDPRAYLAGVALSIFAGLVEFAGVTSVVPALALLTGDAISGIPDFFKRYIPEVSPLSIAILLAVMVLATAAVHFVRQVYFLKHLAILRTKLSLEYIRGITHAGWTHLGKLQPGEVEVMLTRNINISMKMRYVTANLLADAVLSIIYIGIILVLSWYTFFFFVALGIVFWLNHRFTFRWRVHFAVVARDQLVLVARKAIEYFSDIRTLAISDRESFLKLLRRHLDVVAHALARSDLLGVSFQSIHQPLILFFLILSGFIFHWLGQPLATLAGIFYVFYRVSPRLMNVAHGYSEIMGENTIDVVPDILRWRSFIPQPVSEVKIPRDSGIVFHKVDLGYKEEVPLLTAVQFEVRPGELVCIVGKSGTGKSTLLDVICGFQEPRKGKVWLGGVPYHELDWITWRSKLGLLRAEGVVVSGTWVDNVAFLYDDPDEKRVEELLKIVGLSETVQASGGIHAPISARGANLSAGQRQRLLMARALYREPQLLILDEPTSNLDQNTEQEIYELLLTLKGKMTIIVVSHRPQILANADRIYEVRTDGTVVEQAAVTYFS